MTLRARRIAFSCYAAALFIGTHFPNLKIRVPHVERPDLIIHLSVFAVWFTLLLGTGWIGPWRRFRSIALCALISAVYACFDEFSQSLPGLNRTSAMDDLYANLAGIGLGTIVALIASRLAARGDNPGPADGPPA
jgi:hypothetical protein